LSFNIQHDIAIGLKISDALQVEESTDISGKAKLLAVFIPFMKIK
jgi:hypothetical protein